MVVWWCGCVMHTRYVCVCVVCSIIDTRVWIRVVMLCVACLAMEQLLIGCCAGASFMCWHLWTSNNRRARNRITKVCGYSAC